VRPFNDITYTLRVENELGCFDSATVQLTVAKNKRVYFPNVFNPDAENVENTFFYPSGDRFTRISNLAVFSRWGEKIFEAMDVGVNDMNAGWDGTHRGQPMLPGVYVWVATIAFLDGESVTYSGDVTLVR
jgi:gliding motility-associated-like protein